MSRRIYLLSQKKLDSIVEKLVEEKLEERQRSLEIDTLKRQMEMEMLQAQINPHFLYNTLECIRGHALLNEDFDIAEITQALSRYFRYGISLQEDAVSIEDELDNVRNYFKIQQYRFKNRFRMTIEYDHEDTVILEAMLPKLTLQPLVENAIQHGFMNKRDNAVIKISIVRTQHHINITVSDNGEGMSAERVNQLRGKLNSEMVFLREGHSGQRGVALENVSRRLKLYFGPEYGLSIYSVMGHGTDIEIHIPCKV